MDYTEIVIAIRKIVRSINLESKRIQKDLGISIPQLLALGYLSQQDGYQCSHGALKSYLNLNSSTVTGIISRLEKKGYLARLPKMNDKRVTNVVLTASGHELLEASPDILHDKFAKKLVNLPPEQITEIKSGLDLLISVMEIGDIDASPLLMVEDPPTE